jgi:hypothetical protein
VWETRKIVVSTKSAAERTKRLSRLPQRSINSAVDFLLSRKLSVFGRRHRTGRFPRVEMFISKHQWTNQRPALRHVHMRIES